METNTVFYIIAAASVAAGLKFAIDVFATAKAQIPDSVPNDAIRVPLTVVQPDLSKTSEDCSRSRSEDELDDEKYVLRNENSWEDDDW